MNASFWIWSHFSVALWGVAAFSYFTKKQRSLLTRLIVMLIAFGCSLLPIAGTDVAGYALGHFGTLSVTSLVLLWLTANKVTVFEPTNRDRRPHARPICIALLGVILYPAALGFLPIDFYLIGYNLYFAWTVLGLSLFAMVGGFNLLATCCAISVCCWKLQLHESTNLFDYLIDPWVWFYSIYQSLSWVVSTLKQRRTHGINFQPEH